jgi:hypothetical protein
MKVRAHSHGSKPYNGSAESLRLSITNSKPWSTELLVLFEIHDGEGTD